MYYVTKNVTQIKYCISNCSYIEKYKKKFFFAVIDEISRPIRRKPRPESSPDPRFPINNEIPDSANVRANQGPKADVPVSAVQNESKSRTQQLNLGN